MALVVARSFDILRPEGILVRRVERFGPDLTLTEERRSAYLEAQASAWRADPDGPFAADEPALQKALQTTPFPEVAPAFVAIPVDADGNFWLEQGRLPGDEAERHQVFNHRGRLLGLLVMPERFRTLDIGSDYVLGVWRDEFDVERLRVYALRKD